MGMAHGPTQQASVGEGISAGTGGGSSSWLIPDHTFNPNPKFRLKPALERQRLHVPGVHTVHSSVPVLGVPHRHSLKQTDPSVHSPVDAPQ